MYFDLIHSLQNPCLETELVLDNYNSDTLIVITDNAIHLYSKKNYEFEQYEIGSRPTNYFKHKNNMDYNLSNGVYKLTNDKKLIRYKFEPLKSIFNFILKF